MNQRSTRPYHRPTEILPRPHRADNEWPYVHDAFNELGRAKFGVEWSGTEIRARAQYFTAPEPPRKWDIAILESGWNSRAARAYESQMEWWEREKDNLRREREEEPKARKRFEAVFDYMINLIRRGKLLCQLLDPATGDQVDGNPKPWGAQTAEMMFKSGKSEVRHPPSYAKFEGWMLINRAQLQDIINESDYLSANKAQASGKKTHHAQLECEDWLRDQIEAARHTGKKTRDIYEAEALEFFEGRLSKLGFKRAWAATVPDSWKKAGAPRKITKK